MLLDLVTEQQMRAARLLTMLATLAFVGSYMAGRRRRMLLIGVAAFYFAGLIALLVYTLL